MLENDRCLHSLHLGPRRELVHREIAKVIRVTHSDVNKEIITPSQLIDRDDLGQGADVNGKGIEGLRRMNLQSDGNHRLKTDAQHLGVSVGMKSAKDPISLEPTHPFEAARRRQPDLRRELLVREPCIVLKSLDDFEVDSIQPLRFRHTPNYIR